MFPAIIHSQYGDVYLGVGPCVLNTVIGSMDPELDLKTFTTRVRRLPLAQLDLSLTVTLLQKKVLSLCSQE